MSKGEALNLLVNQFGGCQEDYLRYFDYLDALRMSGVTNMFGASVYLIDEFGLSKALAKRVLSLWMDSFGK